MTSDARKWTLLITGILGSMVIANGLLIKSALSDGGPDAEPDAYEKGLKWDQSQAERVASAKLGWQVTATLSPESDSRQAIHVQVRDRDGQPVVLDKGTVTLVRPADVELTHQVELAADGSGQYQAQASMPRPGLWELDLALSRGGEKYRAAIRTDVAGVK